MINPDLFDKIDDFLDGKLSLEEQEAFKAQIAQDENLAEQVALQKLERELGEILLEEEIAKDIEQWKKKESPQKPTNRIWIWIVLIGIGLLLVVGYRLFRHQKVNEIQAPPSEPKDTLDTTSKSNNNQDSLSINLNPPTDTPSSSEQEGLPPVADNTKAVAQQIALANINLINTQDAFRNINIKRGANQTAWEKACTFLQDSAYTEAIPHLLSVPESDELYFNDARFNLALIYLTEENYTEAILEFEGLLDRDYLATDQVEGYLLLAYLGNQNLEKAEELLDKILSASEEHPFYDQAQEIKEQLQKIN